MRRRIFRRSIIRPVCSHDKNIVPIFNGPVKPVFKCLDCNEVIVGDLPIKKDKK